MAGEPAGAVRLWFPADNLTDRVRKLRTEYFSYSDREYFRNEIIPFICREDDDIIWSPHNWGVSPELHITFKSFQDSLMALGKLVELPDGFWSEPIVVRRAIFFDLVISCWLPVKILDEELIVGSFFNSALSRTLTPQEGAEWRRLEDKWFKEFRKLDFFGIGNNGAVPGHLIPNYPKVLRRGFEGLKNYFLQLMENSEGAKRDFLRALIICCEATRKFAERYALEAEKLAQQEKNDTRKAELKKIAETCRHVPWRPARDFQEALQSLWFTHMLVMAAESYPGPGLSPGRVDQYLYPFYKQDIETGKITREQAKELIECWFIKHNYVYDFMGRMGTNQGINSGFGQLITLGGIGPDGEDAVNELTWLMLDAIDEMNMLEPKPNIRISENTSDAFLDRIVESLSKAQGAPFLLNFDETAMKALASEGVPKERLWDYAPVGCLENTLQGDDRSGTVDVNLNLAKAVELVFTRGRDMKFKIRLGPKTGDPLKFKSFDEFFDAYKKQLEAIADRLLNNARLADEIRARFEPTPYLSVLVDGCAESGRDVTAGGAVHNFITVEAVGFATAVDSLSAVKKLVFDEKRITMAELCKALKKNYSGFEPLRQLLLNKAPRYGNDDLEADSIAKEVNAIWSSYVSRQVSEATGRKFRAGMLSWNYWIIYATRVSATPDGRKRGTYLSNGICPVAGADRRGPTAVARSVAHSGIEMLPNGASHTITFNPSIMRNKEQRAKMKAFLRGYAKEGGTALQINMIDAETLRDAQKKPDEYRNLLVRVTGYNAYFTTLGKEIQDEIINRVSHNM